ncbi:MAG: leucine--tRNA ligase [Candidatus Kaiserbacteria bacterium]|nr:leucine--tRNA ligase [Candidatus Kaiserbacteria bacterium]
MYDHKEIEGRWQKRWRADKVYQTSEDTTKEKCYSLVMFPYPSGDGLHIGHARIYIGADIYARMRRMQGYRVLHPMGWDAFGLPAEGYALKQGKHPQETTEQNVANFKQQCQQLGLAYDWEREINTTDPAYYKWTQWIFLQLYKKGLAYESHAPVNWCPSCKTGLANEDLSGGKCERCDSAVERKPLRQWVLRITDYADQLLDDLETLEGWSESVKEVQRHWIGRQEGFVIPFVVPSAGATIEVFTTRPDTLFGCSYIALSPESGYVETLLPHCTNREAVEEYRREQYIAKADETVSSGMVLEGIFAKHPITGDSVPVYVAGYVLGGYGTGAVFAVPAHDERDHAFAQIHGLPITQVVSGDDHLPAVEIAASSVLINSGKYDGTPCEEAKKILTEAAGGKPEVVYRLQDWVFSRQRYWGEPIPLIHCEQCGVVPVPEEDLPVELPEVDSYEPTGTGESPLAAITEWVSVTCPQCKGAGKRETNTMPQWAGSSWYHLRYIDPGNTTALVDKEKERQWMPVDMYTGGMEHAARHLIYARFWHKVLRDSGAVSTSEPYATLRTVGIVQAEGGGKMSKRSGNVVDPLAIAEYIGVDAVRVYLAHIAPFAQTVAWDSKGVAGPRRFLERVYALREKVGAGNADKAVTRLRHKTILSVTADITAYRFNTAVATLMIFANALGDIETVPQEEYRVLVRLLAPFAPYLADELWHALGNETSVHTAPFPEADAAAAQEETVTIAVQVQGKTRGTVTVPRGSEQEAVLSTVQEDERLRDYTNGLTVKVFVKDKIVSFV